MSQLARFAAEIVARRKQMSAARTLLVGISGIDASGKGFIASRVAESLGRTAGITDPGYHVALIHADGWLNLPEVRFDPDNPAEHFYRHALRLDEMFAQLVLPLRERREIELEADHLDETATSFQPRRYEYRDIDIVLVEGIFIFKSAYRKHFDLRAWVDGSFETARRRAIARAQEGLPEAETVAAYETIFFAAQKLHLARDNPGASADFIIANS